MNVYLFENTTDDMNLDRTFWILIKKEGLILSLLFRSQRCLYILIVAKYGCTLIVLREWLTAGAVSDTTTESKSTTYSILMLFDITITVLWPDNIGLKRTKS